MRTGAEQIASLTSAKGRTVTLLEYFNSPAMYQPRPRTGFTQLCRTARAPTSAPQGDRVAEIHAGVRAHDLVHLDVFVGNIVVRNDDYVARARQQDKAAFLCVGGTPTRQRGLTHLPTMVSRCLPLTKTQSPRNRLSSARQNRVVSDIGDSAARRSASAWRPPCET